MVLRTAQALACAIVVSALLTLTAAQAVAQDAATQREQQIQDARAAVRQSWQSYERQLEAIEVGFKCGVVDQLSANVAGRQLQAMMDNEQVTAGLIGDSTMDIQKETGEAIAKGEAAVQSGACSRLTPAARGELRDMVSSLMH